MSSAIGPSGDRHGHRHPSVVRGGGGAHGAARSDGSAEALLDAIVAISSDLDTRSVLERIVESACRLTGAEYGALGVLGVRPHLSEFITHGMDADTVRRIGDLPTGKGLLAHTLNETLLLDDMSAHPDSAGFPEHHPPMRSLLGVPIRIRGTTFGNLYVTEKRGGGSFDERDALQLQSLASVAGIVIENAQAFSLSERRRRWLEMYGELNELLLPPITLTDAFQRICDAVHRVSAAEFVGVVQVPADGSPQLAAQSGAGFDVDDDELAAYELACRRVISDGEVLVTPFRRDLITFFAPLRAHLTTPGVIVSVFARQNRPDELEERELLTSFAEQAGLALDRTQALQDRAEMAVVSDRDRIARDLHDVVIQRLFAAGLYMQTTRTMADDPALAERLDKSVKDLDQTIRDIRGTIFDLQARPQVSLRTEIGDLVKDFEGSLGFTPSVELFGPVDQPVDTKRQQQLVAALRAALSNVVKHSGADEAAVDIQVTDTHLRIRVTDNGCGLPEDLREKGLGTLRRRTELLGGSIDLWANDPTGTVLVWQVPLHG